MNADDENITQPENRDEEEPLLASETGDPTTPEEESDPGETDTDESAGTIPPVIETPDKTAPNSAAPPRIVAETPLGGIPRPRAVVRPEPSPAAPVEKYEIDDTTKEIAPRIYNKKALRLADMTPAEPTPPKAAEPAVPAPAVEPQPAAPAQPASRVTHTEPPARPDDWADEDISPELAAVLFGERMPKGDDTPAPAAQAPAPAPATAPAQPAPEAIPAAPIALTNVTAVRRLRITTAAHSAAAPEVALQGKTRYMRIEEPLKGDVGQHTTESWHYFKPDYPSLEGRLVKSITTEEILYADGSWRWEYERRYSDGGRDRREVRANTDRTYVERHDEVSKLAAQAGKRVQHKEDAAMILAEPEREEKRGFLSGLLGHDDDGDTSGGAKVWREATTSESRHARKNGGEAFRRRFLGIF